MVGNCSFDTGFAAVQGRAVFSPMEDAISRDFANCVNLRGNSGLQEVV